jgi:hypothetical protein
MESPIREALTPSGTTCRISVELEKRLVHATLWRAGAASTRTVSSSLACQRGTLSVSNARTSPRIRPGWRVSG